MSETKARREPWLHRVGACTKPIETAEDAAAAFESVLDEIGSAAVECGKKPGETIAEFVRRLSRLATLGVELAAAFKPGAEALRSLGLEE